MEESPDHRSWGQKLVDALRYVLDRIKKTFRSDGRATDMASMEQTLKLWENAYVQGKNAVKKAPADGKGDGTIHYLIKEVGNTGKFYVQADRQVLTGQNPELWGKQIERYINEVIREEQDIAIPTADGHILLLTGRSSYKLSDRHASVIQDKIKPFLSDADFSLKGRAATHIDELIQVAKFEGYEPDLLGKHNNDIGEDGFAYYTAFFRDFDGSYYRIPLSSGLNAQEETVYSIGKIRKRNFPANRGSSSKKEALKGGREASNPIIYTSEEKSQEVKTAVQLAFERALKGNKGEQLPVSGTENILRQKIDDDAGYLAAVEAGDMETARKMVAQVAKTCLCCVGVH